MCVCVLVRTSSMYVIESVLFELIELLKQYREDEDNTKHPPHVWTIARCAYHQLLQQHGYDNYVRRQAIIISGESGGEG